MLEHKPMWAEDLQEIRLMRLNCGNIVYFSMKLLNLQIKYYIL